MFRYNLKNDLKNLKEELKNEMSKYEEIKKQKMMSKPKLIEDDLGPQTLKVP